MSAPALALSGFQRDSHWRGGTCQPNPWKSGKPGDLLVNSTKDPGQKSCGTKASQASK